MGGGIIGFSDSSSTSTKKGETLADTMSMVSRYVDAIVMRHPRDGAARLAADHSLVPIINGGDGANQHPTQTFLDLSTIDDFFPGRLENGPPLLVALAGDLRYGRTVHSLAQALTHFQAEIILSPVPGLEMPVHHIEHLQAAGITVHADTSLAEAAKNADVLYMTRLQRERFADPVEFDHVSADYCLTGEMLQHAKPGLRVLHPLPRVKEISAEVDGTPHAAYFEQAGNGVAVRQAVLALVMGRLDPDHLPQVSPSKAGT
jgi:aspartate carbamoyltransferase catalytic subunit